MKIFIVAALAMAAGAALGFVSCWIHSQAHGGRRIRQRQKMGVMDRVLLLGDAMCEEFYADKPFHTPEAVLAQFDYIDSLGDIDWYLLSHAAPQNNHHFALTYEVLRVAAEGYRQGYTEKTMLGDYIKENLDVGTPDDYEQTAEFFYNGQFGTRYDL